MAKALKRVNRTASENKTVKQEKPKKRYTVKEIRNFAKSLENKEADRLKKKFEEARNSAIQLRDITKKETRSYSTFNKTKLRDYLKSPYANQEQLRKLSQFLFRYSQNYRDIIMYNAKMIDLDCRSVIPLIELGKDNDTVKITKLYYDTLLQLNKMNLQKEILKCAIIAWREDSFYGITFEDETGFFIMPLDGNYCMVSSTGFDGSLNFALNFSYFKGREYLLEYYGEPFASMYEEYKKDSTGKLWQEIPPERSICLKINNDDLTMDIPPFVGLFEELIDLVDLRAIQAVKDDLSIYKLLVFKVDTIKGSDEPDDFAVDLDTCIEFYDNAELPEGVSSIISPMDIQSISFKEDQTSDVNRIEEATKNLFNNSGGAQILNSSSISGSTAFTAAILADTIKALRPILKQIEVWTNRYLTFVMGKHATVKYLEVSPLTKESYRKGLLENGTYGEPVRLALNTLNGFNELETLSLQFLEQDCLKLHENLKPMLSSHTQSNKKGNQKDAGAGELTDEGEKSRDKETN